jgi:hypothetical protein
MDTSGHSYDKLWGEIQTARHVPHYNIKPLYIELNDILGRGEQFVTWH